jgi:hypothetical protein
LRTSPNSDISLSVEIGETREFAAGSMLGTAEKGLLVYGGWDKDFLGQVAF